MTEAGKAGDCRAVAWPSDVTHHTAPNRSKSWKRGNIWESLPSSPSWKHNFLSIYHVKYPLISGSCYHVLYPWITSTAPQSIQCVPEITPFELVKPRKKTIIYRFSLAVKPINEPRNHGSPHAVSAPNDATVARSAGLSFEPRSQRSIDPVGRSYDWCYDWWLIPRIVSGL